MLHESHNMLVMAGNRLVACVGVEDMVVIETPDAILVAHMTRTQDVKKIVDSLKQEGRSRGRVAPQGFSPLGLVQWSGCR